MYLHTVKQLCQYMSSLCSLHKQLCLFIAAPITSTVHVMRENYTAATVENIRNKKCQVSLCVPGHVPAQVTSSFFIPLEALFPDNSRRSIQTQTVPCDMPAIVLLAPEGQHPEQKTNVQPDVESSPPSARPKKMRQQGMFQCLYPGCTKSFTRKHDLTRHEGQHEGDVFKCEMCPSEFTLNRNL